MSSRRAPARHSKSARPHFRRSAPQRRRLLLETLEDRQLLAAFTPGNIVAYRVGTGASLLTNAATPVFLDEFIACRGLCAVDFAANVGGWRTAALNAQGTGTSEGLLTLSVNGEYLLLTGYDAPSGQQGPGASALSTTSSAAFNRVVGRVDSAGNVDTSTALQDFSSGNIRSAASTNGTDLWVSGSNGGVRFGTFGQIPPATTMRLTPLSRPRGAGHF